MVVVVVDERQTIDPFLLLFIVQYSVFYQYQSC